MVDTGTEKVLIDCGMFQGGEADEAKNHNPLPFNAAEISAVLITHCHLDHVGRLPLLVQHGFAGSCYATRPTIELTELVLRDTLGIMTYNQRKFGTPALYSEADVIEIMSRFRPVEYDKPVQVGSSKQNSITATYHEAGHIFGSAFIELSAGGKRVVFSGDVGNVAVPILRDTEALPGGLDAMVCESTYGSKHHEGPQDREKIFTDVIADTIRRRGTLMIPSFSIERSQELLYVLNSVFDRKHLLPRIPVFLDSPLAIGAARIIRQYPEYYDAEAKRLVASGDDLFNFPGLVLTESKEESKKINGIRGPKIIIAGAGMMSGGRIVHHALRYLSAPENTLLFVGYQAHGTLGRRILEGESPVKIMGESVPVRCVIKVVHTLSAHGDEEKLLSWIKGAVPPPRAIYLNHGDPAVSSMFVEDLLRNNLKSEAVHPGERVEV